EAFAWALREVYFLRMNTPEDAARIKTMIYKMKIHNVALEEIFNEIENDIAHLLEIYGTVGGILMYLAEDAGDKKFSEEEKIAIEEIAVKMNSRDRSKKVMSYIILAMKFPELYFELENQYKLTKGMTDQEIMQIVEALGSSDENEKILEEFLGAERFHIRQAAISAIEPIYKRKIENIAQIPAVVDRIISLLNDKIFMVRYEVITSFAVEIFLKLNEMELSGRALEKAGELEDKLASMAEITAAGPEALSKLYTIFVRNGKMNVADLEKKMDDRDIFMEAAIMALGTVYPAEIRNGGKISEKRLKKLLDKLYDEDNDIREESVITLNSIMIEMFLQGHIKFKELLVKFDDKDDSIRMAAYRAVGNILERQIEDGSFDTGMLEYIEEKLVRETGQVRGAVINVLGSLYLKLQEFAGTAIDPEKVENLELELSNSRPEDITAPAVEVLGKIYVYFIEQDDFDVSKLGIIEKYLTDSAFEVREAAFDVIAEIYIRFIENKEYDKVNLKVITDVLSGGLTQAEGDAIRVLGLIYSELISAGSIDMVDVTKIEEKLSDFSHAIEEIAVVTLGKLYLKMIENGMMELTDIRKLEEKLDDTRMWAAVVEVLRPIYRYVYRNENIKEIISHNLELFEEKIEAEADIKKKSLVSPYEIRVNDKERVVEGLVNGKAVVRQPILGEVDDEALLNAQLVETPETVRRLIDLFFTSVREKLNALLWLGQTSTGKTSLVRYAAALVGKPFTRIQVNASMDELDLIGHHQPKGLDIKYDQAVEIILETLALDNTGRLRNLHEDASHKGAQWFKMQKALQDLMPSETGRSMTRKEISGILHKLINIRGKKDANNVEVVRSLGYLLEGGGIVLEFKKAPFLEALEAGHWILLDEINLAREEALGI
ncbi:MAG: hypothetical protein ABIH89_04495, partial [Elusimicrobiota bacterium]